MYHHIQETLERLDHPDADGQTVREIFADTEAAVETRPISTDDGRTEFVRIEVPGTESERRTLGVVGRLGGIGARPDEIGVVSDADGAVVAIAAAWKLATMASDGDRLPGDVIVGTHVCPDAPTIPHDPVPFMTSPVDMDTMNEQEIDRRMDAILTIDATKGNRVHCDRGFAISPTVKEGWILKVSDDLLDIQERVTGEPPSTLTTTMQDIVPYGSDVHHINSIFQPATATAAPVVGVATTSVNPVAGSATGANYVPALAEAASFVVETAKDYTRGRVDFYDPTEYDRLVEQFGTMEHLQSLSARRESE